MVDDEPIKAELGTIAPVEDLDEAGLFLREHNFTQAYLAELLQDTALEKKLRRRVDWTLMPLLCVTYLLVSTSMNLDRYRVTVTEVRPRLGMGEHFNYGALYPPGVPHPTVPS